MEAVSCVKEVIKAAKQFQVRPSDSSIVALQRQLEVLVGITKKSPNLDFLSPSDLLAVECLTCVMNLLHDPRTKPSLAQKAMQLIGNLAKDPVIKKSLCDTFHVVPCLASYLRQHLTSFSDPVVVLCLQVLQKVAYGTKFQFEESYVLGLLEILLQQVMSVQNEATESCLGLLASMCRNNFSIQTHLKHKEDSKVLYKRLFSYLTSDNHKVVIFSLSSLLSLCLNSTIGDSLFGPENCYQTFILMFKVLQNNDSQATLTFVVDLFKDVLTHVKLQHALSVYSHLETSVKGVFSQITQLKDSGSLSKLLELLLAFSSVNGIRSLVCRILIESTTIQQPLSYKQLLRETRFVEPFFALVHFATRTPNTHKNLPLLALEFLKEIYEEMILLGLNSSVSPRTDLVVPMIMDALLVEEGRAKHKQFIKVRKALQLLKTANCDEAFRLQVAKVINPDVCATLVKTAALSSQSGDISTTSLLGDSQQTVVASETETCVDIVLLTLDTMMTLEKYIKKMGAILSEFLQSQNVVTSVLGQGLLSTQRDQVQIALCLVVKAGRLPEFPLTLLGDAVVSENVERVKQRGGGATGRGCGGEQYRWAGPENNKENQGEGVLRESSISNLQALNHSNSSWTQQQQQQQKCGDLDESVTKLIDRMKDGMGLTELKTSEILSVYDHKLNSLQTKENHTQDLLEAKSLALEQADRLIAQYRSRKAQTDVEAQKMRTLIHDSQKESEELREAVNDMTLQKERLTNNVEQLAQDNATLEVIAEEHKELAQAYTGQTQRLETVQKSLTALKKEHKTMSEMQEMLRRHNETLKAQHDVASEQLAELEEERVTLTRQLKDKEGQVTEFSKSLKRTEARLKKFEKDQEELEVTLDKLTSELSRSEEIKKEQQRQLKTLEVVCRQHEAELKDKEAKLQACKGELDKHTQIAALIHNLSSGKNPADPQNVVK